MVKRTRVKEISLKETHAIRSAVNREFGFERPIEVPGDEHPRTRHLGAFRKGALLGVVSVYSQSRPAMLEGRSWMIAGLAVIAADRRSGVGTALVEGVSRSVLKSKGNLVWCEVPLEAVPFFKALGFEAVGDEFEHVGCGPHRRMLMTPK